MLIFLATEYTESTEKCTNPFYFLTKETPSLVKLWIPEYRDTQMATATRLRFQARDPDPIPPWRDLGGTVV